MIYNGETYYEKNTLGDIVRIRNSSGTIVANYSYDAWGNILTKSGTMADINPFRYRGYYYDNETGFYYLQTRYYDPSIRMFISADNYELTSTLAQIIGQLNMYAYANNNPIMYTDENGEFLDVVLDIGFLIWDVIDVFKDPGNWTNWAALGVDAVFSVVPFVTSGAGKIVKVANVTEDIMDIKKVTIIGESMNRVQDAAMLIGHVDDLYGGYKAYNKLSSLGKGGKVLAEIGGKASNIAWLYGKVRTGYTILDIGIDVGRVGRSSSYIAERIFLRIWKSRNVWKSFYHLGG